MVHLAENTIDKEDLDYLIEWLKTNPHLTKGLKTIEFEKKWAKYIGTKYSLLVNSGSSANLLMVYALKEMGLKNNKVIVPAVSWATTVAPVLQLGLEPIICDTDKNTLGVDLDYLEYVFKKYDPSLLIAANILGFPCDYNKINYLCGKYRVQLVEDSCETVGSTYRGLKTGNFGLMSSFSLYFGHHISTIEGGVICTDNDKLYNFLLMARSHGWSRDLPDSEKLALRTKYKIDKFKEFYTFYIPGFNLRSTDLQAYIGLRQIDKLKDIVSSRFKNFEIYQSRLKNSYWKINPPINEIISNFAYPIIHPKRDKIVKALVDNEIECRPLVCGSMSEQPFLKEKCKIEKGLRFSLDVDRYGFYVPNHQFLTGVDIQRICSIINGVIE